LTLSAAGQLIQCPLPQAGWGISRLTLDRLLWEHAQQAGAVAWDRSPVTGIEGDASQGFSLTLQPPGRPLRQLQARAVIAAAGRHWRSPRATHEGSGDPHRRFIGFRAHFQQVQIEQCIELHAVPAGYCGVVQVEGGLTNVCCLIRPAALQQAGGTLDRLYASMVASNPHLQARMRNASRLDPRWITVGFFYQTRPKPVEAGIWKVGDSAAMIAPLTGDGMGMALCGAELAAETSLAALRGGCSWEQATAAYARRWRHEFSPRLRWGRWLNNLVEAVADQPHVSVTEGNSIAHGVDVSSYSAHPAPRSGGSPGGSYTEERSR
jgi:flavin-dependent dehydrogenase